MEGLCPCGHEPTGLYSASGLVNYYYYYLLRCKAGAKGDWDFWISDLVKIPDGTDI